MRCLKRYVAREVYPCLRAAPADSPGLRGRPDPLIGCRTQVLAFYRFVGRPRSHTKPAARVT